MFLFCFCSFSSATSEISKKRDCINHYPPTQNQKWTSMQLKVLYFLLRLRSVFVFFYLSLRLCSDKRRKVIIIICQNDKIWKEQLLFFTENVYNSVTEFIFHFSERINMNQTEFLGQLRNVRNSYRWEYVNNNFVGKARYGKDRGRLFNPVTAVARSVTGNYYPLTDRGTEMAAKALNLSQSLLWSLVSLSNRGNAQVVRGRVLSVVRNSKGGVAGN